MVRKENRLYNTVLIILSIQVITWIRQDSNTVSIKTLQLLNRFSERTPFNQYSRIMKRKYRVGIKETSNGFADVEASSEEEAREKAYDAWANGYADMCGDVDCETVEVWPG